MSPYNALFFAGAGLNSVGNEQLFKKLESQLPELFPDLTFAFLPDPFEHCKLPFLLDEQKRNKPARCKILGYGEHLGCYVVDVLEPALAKYDVVFARRFGLTGATRATAFYRDNADFRKAMHAHHNYIVEMFIADLGLYPPIYIIPKTEDVECVLEYMYRKRPELRDVPDEVLRHYIEHQLLMTRKYFEDDVHKRQHTPIELDARKSIEEMCGDGVEQVVLAIESRLKIAA